MCIATLVLFFSLILKTISFSKPRQKSFLHNKKQKFKEKNENAKVVLFFLIRLGGGRVDSCIQGCMKQSSTKLERWACSLITSRQCEENAFCIS